MLFWHLGVTASLIYLTLGRRRIDYRVVLAGAVLPDIIDRPIGRIFFERSYETSHLWGHTMAFVLAMMIVVTVALRGDAARRWFVLPVAVLVHLALDGMWNDPVTLFWPLFGVRFPPMPTDSYWLDVLLRPFTHPLVGLQELIGLGLLLYMGRAFSLHRRAPLKRFLRTGALAAERELPA